MVESTFADFIYTEKFNDHTYRYLKLEGNGYGLLYLPGHRNALTNADENDRSTSKIVNLFKFCRKNNIPLLIPEWIGFGESLVDESVPINPQFWLEQAADCLVKHGQSPMILAGFSMGGWLSLSLAMVFKNKFTALITLAAGFGEGLVKDNEPTLCVPSIPESRIDFTTKNDAAVITTPLDIECSISLIHSYDDSRVSWLSSMSIMEHLKNQNAHVNLIKTGGHQIEDKTYLHWLFERILYYRNEAVYYHTYTPEGVLIGPQDRKTIHAQGLYHKAIKCVLQHAKKPEMLYVFQFPSWHPVYPLKISLSVTGHVGLQESTKGACQRKLEHDHMITQPLEKIHNVGNYLHQHQRDNYIENETIDVFFTTAPDDYDPKNARFLSSAAIHEVPWLSLSGLMTGRINTMELSGVVLEESGATPVKRIVSRTDFVQDSEEFLKHFADKIHIRFENGVSP